MTSLEIIKERMGYSNDASYDTMLQPLFDSATQRLIMNGIPFDEATKLNDVMYNEKMNFIYAFVQLQFNVLNRSPLGGGGANVANHFNAIMEESFDILYNYYNYIFPNNLVPTPLNEGDNYEM